VRKLLLVLALSIFNFQFSFGFANAATEPKCWCTGDNMEGCTLYSPDCPNGPPVDYEGFSICCNEPNLYNSVFALKSPICGSALEKPILGCENGTFADGNTMLFCVGNEFRQDNKAIGCPGTSPVFNGKDNVNFDPGGSFCYNGNSYSSGNVYVCNSIASCCAQGGAGFKCEDIYKPNPSTPPSIVDNNALPIGKRAALCGLGPSDDDLVRYVHTNTDEYEITCADVPVVDIIRNTCSEDAGGEGAPYFKVTQKDPLTGSDYIDAQALVSLAGAKLGGYGPDLSTLRSKSLDALARVYPFNALLNQSPAKNSPRESSGTFWRLLGQLEQMNAKAKLMLRYKQQTPPMRDQEILYAGTQAAQEGEADGQGLAAYMNAIIAGVGANPKIKLLSPAFNITSRFTPPLIGKMISAGANFSALAGCAGNTYTVDGKGAHEWYLSFLAQTGLAGKCKGFVFTEFGDFDTFGKPLDGRSDVIVRMTAEYNKTIADTSVISAIYFNALGGNPEFRGHQLSQTEYTTIVASNPGQAGVNSAKGFDNGAFQTEAANYTNNSGWTLEIAFSPGDEDSVVNSINTALSRGLTPVIRICVGNTCDFSDPATYVNFLQKISSRVSGPFYAIAGPNEPEREQWLGSDSTAPPTPPPQTIKLSELMTKLPGCLRTFPVCKEAITVYGALDSDTKIKYDALIPFNQDNLRGYLALRYVEPVDKQTDVGILTEGLPYIESIKEALDDPSYGIVSALSPGWLNDARAPLSTSETYIPKEQEKNNRSVIEKVADRAKQIWAGDTKVDDPPSIPPGCYLHKKGSTLPAPTTYPRDFPVAPAKKEWEIQSEPYPKNLYQFLRVPVKTIETPNYKDCIIRDKFGVDTGRRGTYYETSVIKSEAGSGRGDGYLTSDIGRSIAVLNNPKMTDISRLISEPIGDTNLSLNAMMLPSFTKQVTPYPNKPLLATGASYDSTIYYYTDSATQDSAQAGGTQSTSGLIARKGGQAHTDLCVLRNFWFRSSGLQAGTPVGCETPDNYINIIPTAAPAISTPPPINADFSFCYGVSTPTGHNVKPLDQLINSLGGTVWNPLASNAITSEDNLRKCYNYIINFAQKRGNDPALVMAAWIEESGASNYARFPTVDDLGCGGGISNNLQAQLNCFVNLQNSYASSSVHAQCRAIRSSNNLDVLEFFQIFACGDAPCRENPGTFDFSCTYTDDQPGTLNWPNQLNQAYRAVNINGSSLNFSLPLPSSDWSR
jgi:hypothetical protein